MEMNKSNTASKQRKFLLMLPIIILPFLIFLSWSLGVGKEDPAPLSNDMGQGLLSSLPELGEQKKNELSKLDQYDLAQRDAQKLQELIRNDPYHISGDPMEIREGIGAGQQQDEYAAFSPVHPEQDNFASEQIYKKLAELQKELEAPQTMVNPGYTAESPQFSLHEHDNSVDAGHLHELQQMLMGTSEEDTQEERELGELNNMLDKVLDIQHPQRVSNQLKELNDRQTSQALPLQVLGGSGGITRLLASGGQAAHEQGIVGFYTLPDTQITTVLQDNAVLAAVHGKQELTNGSTVRLRLLQQVSIGGLDIPKDHLLFAEVRLSGERLEMKISNIRYGHSLLPVDLQVYDLDGIRGVHIPGSITRDGMKESADRSLQRLGLSALDPSWETKAASMGMEAAKNLLSKKIKQPKVTLPMDYRILLFDQKKDRSLQQTL